MGVWNALLTKVFSGRICTNLLWWGFLKWAGLCVVERGRKSEVARGRGGLRRGLTSEATARFAPR